MKKIFIFIAIAIACCSCEKFEQIGDVFKSNTCTIENSTPLEEVIDKEIVAEAISSSMQVIVYEMSANISNEKYLLRSTAYSLEYGNSQKFILDSRAKYVFIELLAKIKTTKESVESSNRTKFIKVEKNMFIMLDKEIFEKSVDK